MGLVDLSNDLGDFSIAAIAPEDAIRLTAKVVDRPSANEGFEGVIKQLMRNGMTLPADACVTYQDVTVGTVAVRLCAIVGTLAPTTDPPEWTLLVILGSPSQHPLPPGIQLQVSESTTRLIQLTLTPPDAYLFAKVIGTLNEQFSITLTLPTGETLTLPSFRY